VKEYLNSTHYPSFYAETLELVSSLVFCVSFGVSVLVVRVIALAMLLRKQFNVFAKVARFSTTAKPAALTKAGEFYQNMIYRGRDVSSTCDL
jgi:hypothetical protein